MAIDGNRVVLEFQVEQGRRRQWESHWQKVADFVFPTRLFTRTTVPGDRRNRRIFDDTAEKAAMTLAAGLHSRLTNPQSMWFGLTPTNLDLLRDQDVMAWLFDTTRRVLSMFADPEFGFDVKITEVFMDLAGFGTGAMIMFDTPTGIRFMSRPLTEIFLREDFETGQIVAVYRNPKITARDAVRKWGVNAGRQANEAAMAGGAEANREIPYIQCVARNDGKTVEFVNIGKKEWISIYVEQESGQVIDIGGFDHNPYITPRWMVATGESYGRGPGIMGLPSIAMANAIAGTIITGAEKAVSPPLEVEANSIEGPIRTQPNGITYVRTASGRPAIRALDFGNNIPLGLQYLETLQRSIKETFFSDLMGPQPDLRRTNREAVQLTQQTREGLVSPHLARLQQEGITPVVSRAVNLKMKRGELLPLPDALRGDDGGLFGIDIKYLGPMSLAQRSGELLNLGVWSQLMRELATVDPRASLYPNVDEIAVESASLLGVNPRFYNTKEEVDQRMAQIQGQQQQAEQLALANTAADTAEKAANAQSTLRDAG